MESDFKFQEPASLDLSIIIVSFNTRDILLGCIDGRGQLDYYQNQVSTSGFPPKILKTKGVGMKS